MKYNLPHLPINEILPRLRESFLNSNSVVLAAEPGSGKTTIVPLFLLNEPWLAGKKIIILEPRRIAARMAAKRMSELAADVVGGLVGYRMRFERKIGRNTRIEVVTEGLFIRMLQSDPELAGVGLVIFDEFHGRSIGSDLALALSLDVRELRDDLRILIMSATMDTSQVSRLLGGAPVITGKGRCFPVKVHYLARPSTDSLVMRTVKAILRAILENEGDILVFLPGAGEIKAVQGRLEGDFICLPLYGDLPQEKQNLIFVASHKRRIILATPIAETSLTIEGVAVVVDSGAMKIPCFSPATGLTALHTVVISKASAEQRAGRAGRLSPGVCYRLWTQTEHYSKADFLAPEIISADLAPLFLEVLQWGVRDPGELNWLDRPRNGQIRQARELLIQLGVLDSKEALSDIGRQLAALPLHPRLAMLLLRGRSEGSGLLACQLAAILQNRDLFRRGGSAFWSVDIEERLDVLRIFEEQGAAAVRAKGADPHICRRILREVRQYRRLLGGKKGRLETFASGTLLAFAYPDRIAQKKPASSQHLLASGRGVLLPEGDHLHKADFLVAAHLDGGKKQGRIFLGAAISYQEIISEHAHLVTRTSKVVWHKNHVEAVSVLMLGHLELAREPLLDVDPEMVRQCLLSGVQKSGISSLGWHKKSRELQARMQFAHLIDLEGWPDVSDSSLLADISWLAPYLAGMTNLKQVKKIDLYPILFSRLSWQDQQELESLVPSHFQVPSGSKIRLLYKPGETPVLAVRLQEMFGATATPAVFAGKVPLLVHLLSPAGRPIQVTQDLMGFWQHTYGEVKKELQGRYPKHFWPDDPLTAKPTRRVRPRK